ncbi:MAG: hypothetical protein ACWGSQ_18170, partial [Longimicrobiales bacterium]
MNAPNQALDDILRGLQERAKELLCLYQVGEILRSEDIPWDDKLRQMMEAIPPGWQYPEVCEARVSFGSQRFESAGFRHTPWVMQEPIKIRGEEVGALEVAYTEERPAADEGPFLREERKLLRTLAEEIGFQLTHEEMTSAWETWQAALNLFEVREGQKWKVIIDFLQRADPQLLLD